MGVSKQAAQQRLAKAAQVELPLLSPEQGFTRFSIEACNLLMAAHEGARVRQEPFVTTARVALAAGIETAESLLPKPAKESQDLVPYDEDAQRMLARAFELAIEQTANMVDVSHVVETLGPGFPER